jgi:PIN domain
MTVTVDSNILSSGFLFLDAKDIHQEVITQTQKFMQGLDVNDFLFVATIIYFEGLLWTGDVKLKKGLNRKGFYHVITTSEFKQIIKGI